MIKAIATLVWHKGVGAIPPRLPKLPPRQIVDFVQINFEKRDGEAVKNHESALMWPRQNQ